NLNITVDDGSVSVPINNLSGEQIGLFSFRPTDVGIIERYNKIAKDFDEIIAPLESANISGDGTASDETSAAALEEAGKRLYEAVDFLFGGNTSEAFFGKMHPFSPVGGNFYCVNVLNAVGQFIAAQFDKEINQINGQMKKSKAVAKYTEGYET
ncbi:MAG: hypothetical protein LUE31_10285, partial [Lachnospiraceae bacterium]|nr:hypothetical protein [Lachnospiraceae bacterium]